MSVFTETIPVCPYDAATLYRLASRAMDKLNVPQRWRDDAMAEFVMAAHTAGQSADGRRNVQTYQCVNGNGAVLHFMRREYRNEQLSPAACPKGSSRISLDKKVPGMDGEPTTLAETVVDREMLAPDARLRSEEKRQAVYRALRTLPSEWFDAVRLVWLEGKRQNEAARHLRIPRKTLRQYLAKARIRLRAWLIEYADEYSNSRFPRK